MKQLDKKKLLEDIEALIFISDRLALAFDFRVQELRDKYQNEIRQYNHFKEMIYGKTLDIGFEMVNKNGKWTVSIPGCPGFDSRKIPVEIIKYITSDEFFPGVIKWVKDFETEDGRIFNFNFDKHNEKIISGAIKENRERLDPFTDLEDKAKTEEIKKKMNKLYDFIHFLMENETFYHWLMGQFNEHWKPLIESGLFQEKS